MAVVELCSNYYIERDPLNCTLKQRYQGNGADGSLKEAYRTIGYYPTMESALRRFCELMRLEELGDGSYSLFGYLEAIKKADKRVEDFLREYSGRFGK